MRGRTAAVPLGHECGGAEVVASDGGRGIGIRHIGRDRVVAGGDSDLLLERCSEVVFDSCPQVQNGWVDAQASGVHRKVRYRCK